MVFAAVVLDCTVGASTLELATVNVGSGFSTCLSSAVSTNDGTTATINCGGQRAVTGFPLPALMSTQAFASANPGGAGVRAIVDIQNAINTGGVIGVSNDPALFNSFVGYNLDIQTEDDVTFSAGATAVFTWGIHEHIVNLGNGFITETASFGFAPVLFDSDVLWTCDRICSAIGTFVPGTGAVVDMNLTRTQQSTLRRVKCCMFSIA
jgi:hypothetical protein